MEELKVGDLVVLKTDWSKVYTLIRITDDKQNGTCFGNDMKEVSIPMIALEKYDAVRTFGI